MDGVGFLGTILIGLVAGWLAARVTDARSGMIGYLILGVVGAVVFGWLAASFNVVVNGKVANLVGGTIGAVLLITLYRAIRRA
jgi:uncharacterized membrane protein YeaQ/YmgE (transglycosylase-associated protein family)